MGFGAAVRVWLMAVSGFVTIGFVTIGFARSGALRGITADWAPVVMRDPRFRTDEVDSVR